MPHFMLEEMAALTNETLGEQCTYTFRDGGSVSTHITIDRNNKVTNDFGVLVGYQVSASLLKRDVPEFETGDTFVDPDGTTWRVEALERETTAKWYVVIVSH